MKLYAAIQSGAVFLPDGTPMMISVGDVAEEGSPVLADRPDMFAEIVVRFPAPAKPAKATSAARSGADAGDQDSPPAPGTAKSPKGS